MSIGAPAGGDQKCLLPKHQYRWSMLPAFKVIKEDLINVFVCPSEALDEDFKNIKKTHKNK